VYEDVEKSTQALTPKDNPFEKCQTVGEGGSRPDDVENIQAVCSSKESWEAMGKLPGGPKSWKGDMKESDANQQGKKGKKHEATSGETGRR